MRALWMLCLFCVAGTAAAQGAYPVKPVRFISPFAPGGGTDTVARALAQRMGDALGKSFIVDNRPGAEGIIGTELGAKSPPDGYTLLVANLGTLAINPNLRKVPYDPLRDFAPVIQTTSSSTVLVVHPSLPAKSVRDLVALAKAKPLNYGASSSATFLPMEMLKQMAKFEMTHVPYKGTGPALTGILSGEVQAMRSGTLRARGVAADRRARALPDVPTVAESGFPGYEANSWNGIVAPAGTPRAIVARLNGEMLKILALKEVVDYMTADGAEPAGNTPEHFGSYIRSEHAKWQRVIRDAMIASQ
jgi:tripartite-type tricarboxylate transporter receptor subunit TctC